MKFALTVKIASRYPAVNVLVQNEKSNHSRSPSLGRTITGSKMRNKSMRPKAHKKQSYFKCVWPWGWSAGRRRSATVRLLVTWDDLYYDEVFDGHVCYLKRCRSNPLCDPLFMFLEQGSKLNSYASKKQPHNPLRWWRLGEFRCASSSSLLGNSPATLPALRSAQRSAGATVALADASSSKTKLAGRQHAFLASLSVERNRLK